MMSTSSAAPPLRRTRARVTRHRDLPLHLVLAFLALLTYIPLVLVLVNAFKSTKQYLTQIWLPVFPPHPENFVKALPPIWKYVQNSLLYSIPTIVLVLVISGITGYTFARYRFRGREVLFLSMLILTMLPGILLVIPMFTHIVSIGWINTTQAIVLPWTAVQIPFGMFLMRTFFETLPREYFEAARLDGAGELQLFSRIAVPLALPALSTLGILTLLFTWNDLIWPLIAILDADRYPISIGVLMFGNSYKVDYGALFAGYVLSSVPLLLIFSLTAKRFMAGLSGGISL
jgi:ABC-type glycerol-3-phosphate transport system permease component